MAEPLPPLDPIGAFDGWAMVTKGQWRALIERVNLLSSAFVMEAPSEAPLDESPEPPVE